MKSINQLLHRISQASDADDIDAFNQLVATYKTQKQQQLRKHKRAKLTANEDLNKQKPSKRKRKSKE